MDIRGCIYILLAASMWGLIGPISKLIFAEGITPLEAAFWRATFGWSLFLAHAALRGEVRVSGRDTIPLLAFGLVCISVFYGAYQLAIESAGVAVAAVLLYTAPAWVAVLSYLFVGEEMNRTKALCVLMTILGVGIISLGPELFGNSTSSVKLSTFGLITGLVSGLAYALYYIFGKKYLGRYSTPTIFVYAMPVGALTLLPFVEFSHKSPQAWLFLIALAAITSYGAFSTYYAGLKRLEATRAAVLATFEPVVAAVLAYLFFGERFGIFGYAGSLLILAAVFLVVMGGLRSSRVEPELAEVERKER